ncbi:MAG TPA: PAS domain S-box protein [Terriglobales bacterium]|jgi:PAS domain S-box-containing protein|nr:PAS domain S-box protein [Terriglobales bacterium]
MSAPQPSLSAAPRPLRVLFIEDNPADVELEIHELTKGGFRVSSDTVQTPEELFEKLSAGSYDVVLSDYRMPQWTGLDAFYAMRGACADPPFILVTGTLGDELAVECLRKGIWDYVLKEKLARLPFAVEGALREKTLEDEHKRATAERERLLRQTQERMKELTCIYQVTRAVQQGAGMRDIVGEVAPLLPAALRYPELAQARVRFEAEEAVSPGFRESACRLAAPLLVKGEERGLVEVFYTEAPPDAAPGPFLAEERDLVEGIARSLSEAAEHLGAEEALQRSEAHFRALIEQTHDIITIVSAGGTILYQSPAVERVLGYEPGEMLGHNGLEFIHPDDLERVAAALAENTQTPKRFEALEYRCKHKDGSWRALHAVGINLLDDPAVHGVVVTARDITERKRMEEAVRASERQYRELFESANTAILIFEPESEVILEANPEACRAYGFDREELLGKSLKELTRDVVKGEEQIRELLREGSHRDFETVHFRKDGSIIFFLANSTVIEYQGRKSILSVNRDITQRKQAEEALRRAHDELEMRVRERTADLARTNQELRASESRYRLLMEQAADAILLMAPGGRLTGVSSRACELLGYTREELMQMSILDLVHPDPVRTREIELQLEAGGLVCLEEELRCKRGTWIPVEISVRRISANVEQLIARDIRERRRAQEAQEQLAAVLEATSDFVATAELTGPLLYVNPSGRRMVGLGAKEEVYQHTLAEWLSPATRTQVEREVVLGGTWTGEGALLGAAGHEIPVLMVASVHQRPCAGPQFMSLLAHDITQRKQLENVKDELVSMVSHELRTPLASLRGFAELMLTREYDEAKRREFLTIIHKESRRLADLINNFLDLQRIQSGKQIYNFEALELEPQLREAISLFQAGNPKHHLELELRPPLPAARGDCDRVRQVLANLVANALKYSPEGGRVVLGAKREGEEVRIWISDQGIGIPAEILPHLFTKFYRVDNAVNRGIAGTGLGLALVRQIVENHGGRVWAESVPGQGSTFYFSLPVAQEAGQAAA